MQRITTDKLYHLTINSEYYPLPPEIVALILRILSIDFAFKNTFKVKSMPLIKLYLSIDWKWMAERGTLTKRISKWCFENLKHQVSDKALTAIGNAVRKEIVKNQEYHIDFTEDFNWASGQFADSGSCFWDGRDEIRFSMMRSKKFLAARFFAKETPTGGYIKLDIKPNPRENKFYVEDNSFYSGIARAWVYQDEIVRGDVKSPIWIVFNGYGIPTKQIATILSSFHGQSIKEIKITNNGKRHGGLYVNGRGYLIGQESLIKDKASFDFGLPYSREEATSDAGVFKTKKALVDRKPKMPNARPRLLIVDDPNVALHGRLRDEVFRLVANRERGN